MNVWLKLAPVGFNIPTWGIIVIWPYFWTKHKLYKCSPPFYPPTAVSLILIQTVCSAAHIFTCHFQLIILSSISCTALAKNHHVTNSSEDRYSSSCGKLVRNLNFSTDSVEENCFTQQLKHPVAFRTLPPLYISVSVGTDPVLPQLIIGNEGQDSQHRLWWCFGQILLSQGTILTTANLNNSHCSCQNCLDLFELLK